VARTDHYRILPEAPATSAAEIPTLLLSSSTLLSVEAASTRGGVITPAQTVTLIQPERRIAASPLQLDAIGTRSGDLRIRRISRYAVWKDTRVIIWKKQKNSCA
jgi:hypothetical protein